MNETIEELFVCYDVLHYSQQMFSIAHPYMASEAIQGTMPGQLSLYANQMVQVRFTSW